MNFIWSKLGWKGVYSARARPLSFRNQWISQDSELEQPVRARNGYSQLWYILLTSLNSQLCGNWYGQVRIRASTGSNASTLVSTTLETMFKLEVCIEKSQVKRRQGQQANNVPLNGWAIVGRNVIKPIQTQILKQSAISVWKKTTKRPVPL